MATKINKKILAYVVGIAIGDGNLSNPNGRATRLRITCDAKYEKLIQRICSAIEKLLPHNKVSTTKITKTYTNISSYSNQWENWLGWEVGKGPKYLQKVSVPSWIKENKQYSMYCLRGLLETDGSIYNDRDYKMVGFVTIIPNLASDVLEIISNLGFCAHCYKINPKKNKYNFKQQPTYRIRISKNVAEFLDLIKPEKN